MKKILLALLLTTAVFAQDRHILINATGTQFSMDKRYHAAAGALAGAFGYAMAAGNNWKHPWLYGILASLLAGVVKELYDYQRGGTFDGMDAIYTTAGGAFSVTIIRFTW